MRRERDRTALVVTVLMLCGACYVWSEGGTGRERPIGISLETMQLPDTGPLIGLSNLMFEPLPAGRLKVMPAWNHIEFALLSDVQGSRPVYAVRFRGVDSVQRVVVDLNADADLTNDEPLHFRHVGTVDIADAVVRLRRLAGTERELQLRMQVIVSAPYTYGRISEYRRGSIAVSGRDYPLVMRSGGRSSPLVGLTADVNLFIDADRDGLVRERSTVDESGHVLHSESARIDRPFVIGTERFEAVDLDERASRLRLRRSIATVAPAMGFAAPPLAGRDIDGRPHTLEELRGKVVLLSFWAIDCPWSEQVRPALDSLATRMGDSRFAWVAMARDEDQARVRTHLASHPMRAVVLVRDSTSWAEFNPTTTTPLFYLINRAGKVRAVDAGASAMRVIAQAVREEVGALEPQ